jgi:GH43 family beta-xylosidase
VKYIAIIVILILRAQTLFCQDSGLASETFANPIFPSGPDPWITQKDGYYYYSRSSGNGLALRKGKTLQELRSSDQKIVWKAPSGTNYSKDIWAPELHFINDKWYIYFAADDGANKNHRMYVVENPSPDPLEGVWTFLGKVSDPSDKWAIDGSVFEYQNNLYMLWSGWEGDLNGQQNIYIAAMKNPWTIDGKRVKISSPELKWETVGDLNDPNDVPHVNVNEGPVALQHDGKLFVVYSASGCWTDDYCLGLLSFKGKKNLTDEKMWVKATESVFKKSEKNEVYAPGHNSFFTSPDGKENWILYHANSAFGQGCGRYRSPRAQKFTWKSDGSPDFGIPARTDTPQLIPVMLIRE